MVHQVCKEICLKIICCLIHFYKGIPNLPYEPIFAVPGIYSKLQTPIHAIICTQMSIMSLFKIKPNQAM
jgi:hypothetical protein